MKLTIDPDGDIVDETQRVVAHICVYATDLGLGPIFKDFIDIINETQGWEQPSGDEGKSD
jgi:hypothetical protein